MYSEKLLCINYTKIQTFIFNLRYTRQSSTNQITNYKEKTCTPFNKLRAPGSSLQENQNPICRTPKFLIAFY